MTTTDTPVWDWPSTGGDVEYGRLQSEWLTARREARRALSRFGTWEELTVTGRRRTGRGLDVLIPPQLVDRRLRPILRPGVLIPDAWRSQDIPDRDGSAL